MTCFEVTIKCFNRFGACKCLLRPFRGIVPINDSYVRKFVFNVMLTKQLVQQLKTGFDIISTNKNVNIQLLIGRFEDKPAIFGSDRHHRSYTKRL